MTSTAANVSTDVDRALRPTQPLHYRLVEDLKTRIAAKEWQAGEQLPTESALCKQYGVSRTTVRAAMRLLEAQSLTQTRHGIGTFVSPFAPTMNAGLRELRSITETIRAQGFQPDVEYRRAEIHDGSPEENATLRHGSAGRVLSTERAFHADGELIAFSFEVHRADALPEDFSLDDVAGSFFEVYEKQGLHPVTAIAEVHAVHDPDIGWGERPEDGLYLLLDQVHYLPDHQPLVHSRTYFVEGRFTFSLLRTR